MVAGAADSKNEKSAFAQESVMAFAVTGGVLGLTGLGMLAVNAEKVSSSTSSCVELVSGTTFVCGTSFGRIAPISSSVSFFSSLIASD